MFADKSTTSLLISPTVAYWVVLILRLITQESSSNLKSKPFEVTTIPSLSPQRRVTPPSGDSNFDDFHDKEG